MTHRTLVSRLDEGVSMQAASTLSIAHELLEQHAGAELVAEYLRNSQYPFPVEVADVWPAGTPAHWQRIPDVTRLAWRLLFGTAPTFALNGVRLNDEDVAA